MVDRDKEHAQMQSVIAALIAYMDKHPTASDNLEGISRWWLPEAVSRSRTDVERALEQLCAEGKIELCPKAGGHIYFRRRHVV